MPGSIVRQLTSAIVQVNCRGCAAGLMISKNRTSGNVNIQRHYNMNCKLRGRDKPKLNWDNQLMKSSQDNSTDTISICRIGKLVGVRARCDPVLHRSHSPGHKSWVWLQNCLWLLDCVYICIIDSEGTNLYRRVCVPRIFRCRPRFVTFASKLLGARDRVFALHRKDEC